MGNQFSITVSDETAAILDRMKESGYKVSQVIDEAVKNLGTEALQRFIALRTQLKYLRQEEDE